MKNIKKIGLKLLASLISLKALLFAFGVSAQSSVDAGLNRVKTEFPSTGILNTKSGLDLLVSVIKLMLTFAGAVAVMFIIIGGFQYITSAGNAEQAEKGRSTVVNAVIGIIVIVLSYTIINVVINTVQCRGSILSFGC